MKKIVAILTQKNSLSSGIQKNTMIYLFKLEEGIVKGVEAIKPEKTDNNYILSLMSAMKVSMIYTNTIGFDLRNMLSKIGIHIKCKNEITDDKFISQFIFD